VNILGPYPTDSGGVTSAPLVVVTPGPSVPAVPTEAPALTPQPSVQPLETLSSLPTFPPIPTYPPVPTWPPPPKLPTFPPLPLPTLKPPCIHPGTHLGVDPCKWPHQ